MNDKVKNTAAEQAPGEGALGRIAGHVKTAKPVHRAAGARAEFGLRNANYLCIEGGGTLIVIDAAANERPRIIYCGKALGNFDASELALLSTAQHAPGSANAHIQHSLLNEIGTGASGPRGFAAHRNGKDWAADFRVLEVQSDSSSSAAIHCTDKSAEIEVTHNLRIDPATGVFTAQTKVTNRSASPLQLDWCAALSLPLGDQLDRLFGFSGRWANEFQIEEIESFRGTYLRENSLGRTSHDNFPGLYLANKASDENSGDAAGFHLGWSGNHRVMCDRQQDGRSSLQMGELLFPGEIELGEGETYQTPSLYACWSSDGRADVSRKFHQFVKSQILDVRSMERPRPVHYNTWEAVYFDHDEASLKELANTAAAVGAERFVLDDGWFGGRRADNAGLGDWWVSKDVYPSGLAGLAEHVRALGMEFGLWFEPEMVNPDSDLFRAHPDWVLSADGLDTVPFRNQLTLDCTNPKVFDYLFEKISHLVSELNIAYIKWDMNRDTHHPGSLTQVSPHRETGNRAAMHAQTLAVYRLMDKLHQAFPKLEIESCSSGGARADYGVLRHTDRIWTSDNNDARQRQAIQRGASHFFPLQVTGSHVGPRQCHITGRIFAMEYRAATAIFGHMGMELNLLDETEEDRAVLADAIALHKQHRALIHGGDSYRLNTAEYMNAVGCVSADQSEALFSCAQIEFAPGSAPDRLRFAGLDPALNYNVKLVWPPRNPSVTSPSIVEAADLLGDGAVFSGEALMEFGLQLPLVLPDTCLIFHLMQDDQT